MMTMSNNWQAAYTELKDYIAANPRIQIGSDTMIIPEDLRLDFSRLFMEVRMAFLKEHFSSLLDEAMTLRNNYFEAENRLIKLTGLEEIAVSSSLNRLLVKPQDELARVLADPLLDLLKNKMDIDTFKLTVFDRVSELFNGSYRLGYRMWIALSIVEMLAPDAVFHIPTDVIDPQASDEPSRQCEYQVPDPEETKSLSFEHLRIAVPAFTVPDLIIHSGSANRFYSLRTEIQEAAWISKDVDFGRDWYPMEPLRKRFGQGLLWPVIVVYAGDNPNDLRLVADFKRLCRPDIVIESMDSYGWYQNEELEKVRLRHGILRPGLGTYVVSRQTEPKEAFQELMREPASHSPPLDMTPVSQIPVNEQGGESEELQECGADIYIIRAGFDKLQLEHIANALLDYRQS